MLEIHVEDYPLVQAYVEDLRQQVARADLRAASGNYIVTPGHARSVQEQRDEVARLERLGGPELQAKEAALQAERNVESRISCYGF